MLRQSLLEVILKLCLRVILKVNILLRAFGSISVLVRRLVLRSVLEMNLMKVSLVEREGRWLRLGNSSLDVLVSFLCAFHIDRMDFKCDFLQSGLPTNLYIFALFRPTSKVFIPSRSLVTFKFELFCFMIQGKRPKIQKHIA